MLLVASAAFAHAGTKTVCTITVNSPDERETFRRYLPPDQYSFVELVERGRPDWLAASCRAGVRCDVLIISGHFDDGDAFYTDRLDQGESLPVDELERVTCSESCPGVFSQLKEVYLFGCNTLNALPRRSASPELARSLVRAGYPPAEAESLVRSLVERHGESNLDRMRHVFKDVPTLYGFSGKAPLGRYAGPMLDRYFQAGGVDDVARGEASFAFLASFSRTGMTATSGVTDDDPTAGVRRDACHFSDDRLDAARKLAFVHELLQRPVAESRLFLDAIERFVTSLGDEARRDAGAKRELAAIASDVPARQRFLDLARDTDDPAVRVRMLALAKNLGWLAPAEERLEFVRMIADRAKRHELGVEDVGLACARGRDPDAADEVERLRGRTRADATALSAVTACFGRREAHAQVLRALASGDDREVAIAEVYLHHRPIAEVGEFRAVAQAVTRMPGRDAQARALDVLAAQRLSDPESLAALAGLFPRTGSLQVQRAIAGILVRADTRSLDRAALAKTLRRSRQKSPEGADVIDVLIRRLETS